MRELKFRGYSKELNKWFIGALDNTLNWADFIIVHEHGFGIKNRIDSETIGQFTGLKDKNGTDIYDNDIIRILYTDWGLKPEDDPRTLEQYLTDISNIGEVVFNDNAWEVKIYSKKYDDYYHGSISHGTHGRIEIIGNIHENPELLTQQKTNLN